MWLTFHLRGSIEENFPYPSVFWIGLPWKQINEFDSWNLGIFYLQNSKKSSLGGLKILHFFSTIFYHKNFCWELNSNNFPDSSMATNTKYFGTHRPGLVFQKIVCCDLDSRWLNHPFENMLVKLDHFLRDRAKNNKKYLKFHHLEWFLIKCHLDFLKKNWVKQ